MTYFDNYFIAKQHSRQAASQYQTILYQKVECPNLLILCDLTKMVLVDVFNLSVQNYLTSKNRVFKLTDFSVV